MLGTPGLGARLGVAGLWLALAVLACSGPAGAPVTPLVRVVTIDGSSWRVLTASEDGMRGQADFGDADGMLFDMRSEVAPGAVAFVMDGVAIPLDIAWFSADGRHVGTVPMAPCAAEPCQRYVAPGPFRWAIEAPPGAFDGLKVGARLAIVP